MGSAKRERLLNGKRLIHNVPYVGRGLVYGRVLWEVGPMINLLAVISFSFLVHTSAVVTVAHTNVVKHVSMVSSLNGTGIPAGIVQIRYGMDFNGDEWDTLEYDVLETNVTYDIVGVEQTVFPSVVVWAFFAGVLGRLVFEGLRGLFGIVGGVFDERP